MNSNIELALLCLALERIFTMMNEVENASKDPRRGVALVQLGDLMDDLLNRAKALRESK